MTACIDAELIIYCVYVVAKYTDTLNGSGY